MLPRTLEPEVMDSPEEAQDYDSMDHAAVNDLFVADFRAVWNGGIPILDLGTGTAQIPIALCRQVPTARVIAVDAAESMLAVGRENAARAGLSDRLDLQLADAKKLPFANGSFAAVMSNSIVHHIPEPGAVLIEMVPQSSAAAAASSSATCSGRRTRARWTVLSINTPPERMTISGPCLQIH